ncbi:HAMP domain-containing histidine kinase [Staphylococcus simulans]|uniref:sensor histidine kinase n=1 Tax=Staphylococcus simulans TaxID=1286 RepID=UPI0021CE3631|nr:HAMP domain-containing sensor histidine kinase [Staphylococcus simulans]UXR29437.1 HAMP domain-containing histidine kinase [Staphylococcus simulans]
MKLGTQLQIYITLMIAIVVIITNLTIYFIYRTTSLNAETAQLEDKAISTMEELRKAKENHNDKEKVLQNLILTDGYIAIVGKDDDSKFQVTSNPKYKDLSEPYKNKQYKKAIYKKGHHFVLVSIPLVWKDGEVSNLQIFENIDFKYSKYDILKVVLTLSTLFILLIVFLLNRLLTQIILQPINQLIEKMKKTIETNHYVIMDINQKDTKELQALTQTYNDMMENLKEDDEKQQAFISNASHELKTPITVINSYSQMLKRFGKTREDILNESIDAISDEAQRLKYLTEQMLDLAKVERSNQQAERQSVDLNEILEHKASRFAHAYDREIIFQCDNTARAFVNEDQFKQLMTIFLDNAIKYSQDDVMIHATEHPTHINVNISDRGIGIPPEDLEQIFNKFYRVDKARARQSGGSGLGLYIAFELAKRNDIEIQVQSVLDVGTTFILIIEKVTSNGAQKDD